MITRRIITIILVVSVAMLGTGMDTVNAAEEQPLHPIKVSVSKKEAKRYFKKSAFIGSSIGLGQKIYMKHGGKKYLGHPKMIVKGCYSFRNDKGGKYQLSYKGKKGTARSCIKRAKVKRVFINMGTNDMFEGPKKVFKHYKKYIKGIQKKNKGIVVFIESMTPVYKGGQKRKLNNKNVNKLNSSLKKYAKNKKDVYYIDITTALKDSSGGLKRKYASDKYVHLTMSGYKVWTKKVLSYVKKMLKDEKAAKKAVEYAKTYKTEGEISRAQKLVSELHNSTVKIKLQKQLDAISK